MFIIVFILVIAELLIVNISLAKKFITFQGEVTAKKPLVNIEKNSFSHWFRRKDTPLTIFKLNEGLERIECISPIEFRLHLKPMRFPLCNIYTTCECNVKRNVDRIDISIKQGNLKQRFEGMFGVLVSKLTPEITSESSFVYDINHNSLINTATTHIKFAVPSWLPISAKITEQQGTKNLQKTMNRDLNGILDKLVNQYTTTIKLENSKKRKWLNFDPNYEFQQIMHDAKKRLLNSYESGVANL